MNSRRFQQEISPILEAPPGSGVCVGRGAGQRGERSGEPQETPAREKPQPAGERPAAPGRAKERAGSGQSRAARRRPRGPSVVPSGSQRGKGRVSAPLRQNLAGDKGANQRRRWKDPELTSSHPSVFHGSCNSSVSNSGGTSQSPSEAAQSTAGEPRAPPGQAR